MEILVVFSGFSDRPSLAEPLLAYSKYEQGNVSYYNTRLPYSDMYLRRKQFDLIIFSTLFFSRRVHRALFWEDVSAVDWIRQSSARKVATPQDEYINSKYVNEFIDRIGVNIIYSVQPKNCWDAVYPDYKGRKIIVRPILTGYFDDGIVLKVERDNLYTHAGRTTDIVYRTTGVPAAWLGSHARLKHIIAQKVKAVTSATKLRIDISTNEKDLISKNWYKFLSSSKYTIGVEGGTSIIDYDGALKEKVESFVLKNPNASYEKIEASCFPGLDGSFPGYAMSPRHLEACLTKTCQILIEGDYNGILKPWRHYIPLKRDFSNLAYVLELVLSDQLRIDIVNNAYADIVRSGKYLNSSLVQKIIEDNGCNQPTKIEKIDDKLIERFIYIISKLYNSPDGILVRTICRIRNIKLWYRHL